MTTAVATYTEQGVKEILASLGSNDELGALRPDLNGLLVQLPGADPIYLVINGFRRWVPNPQTFINLFVPGARVVPDVNIGLIPEATPLTSGAVLARPAGGNPIYVISNGVKMLIPSMDVFNRYQFNMNNVQNVSPVLIDFIPTGPNVENPPS